MKMMWIIRLENELIFIHNPNLMFLDQMQSNYWNNEKINYSLVVIPSLYRSPELDCNDLIRNK